MEHGQGRSTGSTRPGVVPEWEEASIIALVREDGMTQVELAELLGPRQSWVCRQLALVD